MDQNNHVNAPNPVASCVDFLVKVMNFFLLLFIPKNLTNFRWANSERDFVDLNKEFPSDQFRKVYGRNTARYRYHSLQIRENAIRRFDITDLLKVHMREAGNLLFYYNVCNVRPSAAQRNFPVDLTTIDDLRTVRSAGDYLYGQVLRRRLSQTDQNFTEQSASEAAEIARTNYMRGFTRLIDALDHDDWERLRWEIRTREHVQEPICDRPEDCVTLVALSYKGKNVEHTNRMTLLNEDHSPKKDGGIIAKTIEQMTSDFVDDFRWSQLVRSCMHLAKKQGTTKIRLWIDRLIMNGYEKDEIARRYKTVAWEEFGLLPYAVCHVVRLYDADEVCFDTEFWRKLETVLGVAGRGLIVDDYMLRKYDTQIYYGKEMYSRLGNGLSQIGGDNVYVRATSLALATAILTDGVLTSAKNEHIETKKATSAWKAWGLRTIAEGAYSADHFCMLAQEVPFHIGLEQFQTIAFWESFVSHSKLLTGKTYLDISQMRAKQWITTGLGWDGIVEWVGRMRSSCTIEDRDAIVSFLTQHANTEIWMATSGHSAAWTTLRIIDKADRKIEHKRSLVLNLSAFSSSAQGHVVGVAEASGLWGGKILPDYLLHLPNPDEDQTVEVVDDDGVLKARYSYTPITIVSICMLILAVIAIVSGIAIVLASAVLLTRVSVIAGVFVIITVVSVLLLWILAKFLRIKWPWRDRNDVGEAVFDNLIKHSLFGSGIKKQYRKLHVRRYDELCRRWN